MGYVTIVSTNTARALDTWGEKVGRSVGHGDVEPLTWVLAESGRQASAPELLVTSFSQSSHRSNRSRGGPPEESLVRRLRRGQV